MTSKLPANSRVAKVPVHLFHYRNLTESRLRIEIHCTLFYPSTFLQIQLPYPSSPMSRKQRICFSRKRTATSSRHSQQLKQAPPATQLPSMAQMRAVEEIYSCPPLLKTWTPGDDYHTSYLVFEKRAKKGLHRKAGKRGVPIHLSLINPLFFTSPKGEGESAHVYI